MADKPWLRNRGKKKKKKKQASGNYGDALPFALPLAVEPNFEYVATDTPNKTFLVYDEFMKRHSNPVVLSHPESPERIGRIFSALHAGGLIARCQPCPGAFAATNLGEASAETSAAPGRAQAQAQAQATIPAEHLLSDDDILLAHTPAYLEWVHQVEAMDLDERIELAKTLNSIFLNDCSVMVARYAAKQAGLLAVALARAAAAGEKNTNGIAVIRPPGHHIEANQCLGFGLFNNIAVAARMAQRAVPGTRVMIVDWDIHHGNGTQDIFHDDPSVLFVSIHGYLGGKFFPKGEAGSPSKVGSGAGEGFNLNVGWDQLGREDCDYLAAFNEIVLPAAREFNPDIILVSAGFDAAQYDPLGKCNVTPAAFAAMTRMLMSGVDGAGGRVALFLEGGYHLTALADSAFACTHALLGDECPPVTGNPDIYSVEATHVGADSIRKTLENHASYWKFAAAHARPEAAGGTGSAKHKAPTQPFEKQLESLDAGVVLPAAVGTADGSADTE